MAALDWSQCPAVESIAGKVSGAWVFKGTRMPVAIVFQNLEAGANIEDPAARILGDRFANGESSSWLSDVLRQHSQEWLCHKNQI